VCFHRFCLNINVSVISCTSPLLCHKISAPSTYFECPRSITLRQEPFGLYFCISFSMLNLFSFVIVIFVICSFYVFTSTCSLINVFSFFRYLSVYFDNTPINHDEFWLFNQKFQHVARQMFLVKTSLKSRRNDYQRFNSRQR
jgi:hypothetical protein